MHTGEEEVSVLGREVTVKRRLRPSEERPYLVVHLEQHLDEGAPEPVYQKGDKVKSICECEVEHLPSVQSLILHYKDSAHLPASAFSFIAGIVYADEDEMIMPLIVTITMIDNDE